jgi:ParB family chromosome partitioning protein
MSTNTHEFETTDIPLKKLLAWSENVRTTSADQGIDELAASIASVGLLQSLVVRKAPRGKFAVIAGKRRLQALSQLVEAGTLSPRIEVPCRVVVHEADLTEISLTENVQREPMHPADEFEAFRQLIEKGKCVADVAARFGVTEAVVNRRLALARVSPALLQKYREGEMNLELLQAFTLTDNHEAQEQIWNELQPWDRNPHTVRRLLSQNDIPAGDKRVRFVGLARYEAEGGLVKRDLFHDGEQGVYILDPAKLTHLVNQKLETLAEEIKADGWKWVEVQPEMGHQTLAKLKRIYAEELPLSAEAEAELQKLQDEREALSSQLNEDDDGEDGAEDNEQLYNRIDEIEGRIRSIHCNRKRAYSDDVKATCGVLVSLGFNGEPEFRYGLLRKEDEGELSQTTASPDELPPSAVGSSVDEEEKSSPYSASLVEALTMHKTAAIAAELTQQPTIALAAVVHALALSEFGLDLHLYRSKSCLQMSSSQPCLREAEAGIAFLSLEEQRKDWFSKLPRKRSELWKWCLDQNQETLLRLLAFCAARSLNSVKAKTDVDGRSRLQHANALARALDLDMSKWFTPTAENFFSKVSKARIAEALTEAGKPPAVEIAKLKKAEMAAFAEKEIHSKGWLPEPVRISVIEDEEAGFALDNELDSEAREGSAP